MRPFFRRNSLLIAIFLFLRFSPVSVAAEECVLFILSTPIGASFSLDGVPRPERTPALVRLPEGGHSIVLSMPGYRMRTEAVTAAPGTPGVIDAVMHPEGLTVELFGSKGPNGKTGSSVRSFVRLPDAPYAVIGTGPETRIEPVFPGESLLAAVNVLLPIAAGAAVLATGLEIVSPGYAAQTFPAAPAAAGLIMLTLAGWKLDLELAKRAYSENFILPDGAERDAWAEAEVLYAEAEKSLSGGDLDSALSGFADIMHTYPQSPFVPFALYNSARINAVRGNTESARLEFRVLNALYPHPSLYDRSCKNLADILYRNGAYEESLAVLASMVFIDTLYTNEGIDAYTLEILETWYRTRSAVSDRLLAAYRGFAEKYPSSVTQAMQSRIRGLEGKAAE